MKFLIIASSPNSILNFRGHLIESLISKGYTVHVSSPGLPKTNPLRAKLEEKGIRVHNTNFSRTNLNPLSDLSLQTHHIFPPLHYRATNLTLDFLQIHSLSVLSSQNANNSFSVLGAKTEKIWQYRQHFIPTQIKFRFYGLINLRSYNNVNQLSQQAAGN